MTNNTDPRELSHNKALQVDPRIREGLEELRARVEAVSSLRADIGLRGGTYRGIDNEEIQALRCDGWVIGYTVEDHTVFMRRKIFIKAPGYKIADIPEEQREGIVGAIYKEMIDEGADTPDAYHIAPDTIMIQQNFMPFLLFERKPGIVTPGRKG